MVQIVARDSREKFSRSSFMFPMCCSREVVNPMAWGRNSVRASIVKSELLLADADKICKLSVSPTSYPEVLCKSIRIITCPSAIQACMRYCHVTVRILLHNTSVITL